MLILLFAESFTDFLISFGMEPYGIAVTRTLPNQPSSTDEQERMCSEIKYEQHRNNFAVGPDASLCKSHRAFLIVIYVHMYIYTHTHKLIQ